MYTECYKITTYLSCYLHLVMPSNGKKQWTPVDREIICPTSWNVVRRDRRQKKKRCQAEELVVKHNGGTSKMKRAGTVTMTCGLCGLSSHNKRYHDRRNASNEAKLQPRRSTKSASSQSHEPQQAEFQFMASPGIIPQHISD
ncbi:Uncharacterized protein Adt_06993 [Abeliophyllum distichum]|uniref:Uncharacterized protein n=1 Tax=Abeliophyllum distichum TaxID=126358 RepID=A0ABD1V8I6_9LAMI